MDQNALIQFLPLVLIFVVFYFLLIRPQQKKQKDHRAMLDALRRGDRVVTGGGFFGTVSKVVSPEEVEVDLAPNVRVRVSAQHDHERPGQARPGRGARGGQGTRAPRTSQGKGTGPRAPPTRYSDSDRFRCVLKRRRDGRGLTRQSGRRRAVSGPPG